MTPNLEFPNLYTFEELAKDLKENLPDLKIHIYPRSTLVSELNGGWNVTFSVKGETSREEYFYMLRRDHIFKKNPTVRQFPSLHQKAGSPLSCKQDAFKKVEDFLIEKYDGKRITEFPT